MNSGFSNIGRLPRHAGSGDVSRNDGNILWGQPRADSARKSRCPPWKGACRSGCCSSFCSLLCCSAVTSASVLRPAFVRATTHAADAPSARRHSAVVVIHLPAAAVAVAGGFALVIRRGYSAARW